MPTPITIGILSDTHLSSPSESFRQQSEICFADASVIIHAGDLTSLAVLSVFDNKEIHAVHGNMCRASSRRSLPAKKTLTINGFTIGIIHRAGYSYDFENLLLNEFDTEVDCIIYGHTHKPVCHQVGGILYINPGSFMATGRHGADGTYALLTVGEQLIGRICRVPQIHDLNGVS